MISVEMNIERVESSTGAAIFRIPLRVFPGYIAYSHLVMLDDSLVLIDVGSGLGESHSDLKQGLSRLGDMIGRSITLQDIRHIIISHGHIDHFGGLAKIMAEAPQAKVVTHALSRSALTHSRERRLIARRNTQAFLKNAGVPEERQTPILEMAIFGKLMMPSMPIDAALQDGDLFLGTIKVIHVPGHEAGQIMLQIGDVLLTADHILPATSVALAPECLMPFTGVARYLESLDKAEKLQGIRIALGGHEAPMRDYYDVVRRTRLSSIENIGRVLAETGQPKTIYEVATSIYGPLTGYGELLKIEQAGARIEYLHQRGMVAIDNLEALEHEQASPLAFRLG